MWRFNQQKKYIKTEIIDDPLGNTNNDISDELNSEIN